MGAPSRSAPVTRTHRPHIVDTGAYAFWKPAISQRAGIHALPHHVPAARWIQRHLIAGASGRARVGGFVYVVSGDAGTNEGAGVPERSLVLQATRCRKRADRRSRGKDYIRTSRAMTAAACMRIMYLNRIKRDQIRIVEVGTY
jgi:hypothetical protein